MSDPRVQAAVLAAVITGAVAFAAIVGAIVTTWLTLRRQRNAEDQRRRHERHMRLLESGLKAAVDFLAAADRTSRARQSLDVASRTLDNAKSAANEKTMSTTGRALRKPEIGPPPRSPTQRTPTPPFAC